MMLILGKFVWLWFWLCENLLGINLWEFSSWSRRNFSWLWKNLVVVYRYVKNFDCGEILVGK